MSTADELLRNLVLRNRSYRRFHQKEAINLEQLTRWIDLARLSASGRNAQPIKYIVSCSEAMNAQIFSTLVWAAYLTDWEGPEEGERPAAYVVQLLDTNIACHCFNDDGIAAQSLLLGAVAEGYGGCIFRSINKKLLAQVLNISDQYEIINVIALGKPAETVVIEPVTNGNIKYWRDEDGIHHVPKRSIEELIIKNF